MSMTLPTPIAAYFSADRNDADAVVCCFAEHAVVMDERQTYVGRDAIRQWKTDASAKFSYAVEPHAVTQQRDKIVVTGRVSGDFPGSPVDLRYAFEVGDGEITRLEITP